MPGPKRDRRERTDKWQDIQQRTLWPEQELYEQIRPMLLFGETAGERAKETGAAPRTLSRKANEFEQYGMQSLFSSGEAGGERETSKRCLITFANSSLICILNSPRCLGEK